MTPKNKKTVYIGMCVDILHPGHLNIIKEGEKLGEVVVGLLTDKAVASYKRLPLMNYDQRFEIVKNIKGVSRVIPQTTLDYRPNLLEIKPDYVIHGTDWRSGTQKETRQQVIDTISEWGGLLVEPKYTEGISSTSIYKKIKSINRSILIRLWEYQKERAPLVVIISISALMVALAYSFSEASPIKYFVSVAISVLYLIQIRVSDEKKDFEFDNKYYKNRPVQRGLISLKELYMVNQVVIVGQLILFASFWNLRIFLLGLLLQGYAFLTRREFYIKKWLRKHFLTYNFSHYIQIIILYYALINIIQPIEISYVQILIYFLLNAIVLELIRKMLPKEEDVAGDTYSANLGYKRISFSLALISVAIVTFIYIAVGQNLISIIAPIIVLGWVVVSAFHYGMNPNKANTKYMKMSSSSMVAVSMLSIILGI